MKRNQLKSIAKLYNEGKNIPGYLRDESQYNSNDIDSIMISYDFQAGSYLEFAKNNKDYISLYTNAIAEITSKLSCQSILEVGVGEGTTIVNVMTKMKSDILGYGFDLSWSRIKYAQKYRDDNKIHNLMLFTGNIFESPLLDNSVDIVLTSHSIEPNGGLEKKALLELYCVTSKYLVLLEPCYELAHSEARERMKANGYITNLYQTAKELGYEILEFRLFDYCSNPLNPTSLMIIEKPNAAIANTNPLACPITKAPLIKYKNVYFCKESLLAFPIISNMPCLLPDNAIIATHFEDFNF